MVSINHSLRLCLAASGLLVAFAAGLALFPALGLAEPKPPTEAESADATFAKSFLGKTYDDELEVEG